MSSIVPFSTINNLQTNSVHSGVIIRQTNTRKFHTVQCTGKNTRSTSSSTSSPNDSDKNVFLKLAWYGSELLGIAASFLRQPPSSEVQKNEVELIGNDESGGVIERDQVVKTIKQDFERSYFVTGNLTLDAYEEECEFADPASSFKGLRRFKRNCSNFGSLVENSKMKLMKWEDFDVKGIGHWRFSCTLLFPWRPILSATGYTEYYFDPQSGRVCRHIEHWNVPKSALFKQMLRPGRRKSKKTSA
ncbi:uncharacterized protein LOC113274631 [Papaver somniferum]|uniref:uncharacterized protein LOC113274631 n=1 Tax=Papaver somniferum TaxID=3469 RepID=UPI000E700133|nr:uncharacterized protein LOC113274631 [Papaver somniferum]